MAVPGAPGPEAASPVRRRLSGRPRGAGGGDGGLPAGDPVLRQRLVSRHRGEPASEPAPPDRLLARPLAPASARAGVADADRGRPARPGPGRRRGLLRVPAPARPAGVGGDAVGPADAPRPAPARARALRAVRRPVRSPARRRLPPAAVVAASPVRVSSWRRGWL